MISAPAPRQLARPAVSIIHTIPTTKARTRNGLYILRSFAATCASDETSHGATFTASRLLDVVGAAGRLRCGCLNHYTVRARENRCDVHHQQQSHLPTGSHVRWGARENRCGTAYNTNTKATNKFEATYGSTCAVTQDAGYSGGSLTCNGVAGAYAAVAATTACVPGKICAKYAPFFDNQKTTCVNVRLSIVSSLDTFLCRM